MSKMLCILFTITQSRVLKTLQDLFSRHAVQVSLYKMMQTQVNTTLFSYCLQFLQQMLAIYYNTNYIEEKS